MSKLKELWVKFRVWVGLFVAGMVVSYFVLRKHIGDGLEQQREQYKKENEAKQAAETKLQEETKKIEDKKQEEIKIVEENKKEKLKEAVNNAKAERDRLNALQKRDAQGFVIKIEQELGVKQKKKKGRPKKDE
jgi:flagellar biosynthesis/type III secretory pathway M-ring protein FliF/YscJ